jgi:hypothetical protein
MRALQVEFPCNGVCVNFQHEGGIYRGEWDLHQLGEVGLVPGGGLGFGSAVCLLVVAVPPPHVAGRSTGSASTDLAFSSSCRYVATKSQVEPSYSLASRPRSWAGRWPLGPLGLGSGPAWSTCQIDPRGDDDFVIWSTSPYHPLKCSNLVPKFLKSNKH